MTKSRVSGTAFQLSLDLSWWVRKWEFLKISFLCYIYSDSSCKEELYVCWKRLLEATCVSYTSFVPNASSTEMFLWVFLERAVDWEKCCPAALGMHHVTMIIVITGCATNIYLWISDSSLIQAKLITGMLDSPWCICPFWVLKGKSTMKSWPAGWHLENTSSQGLIYVYWGISNGNGSFAEAWFYHFCCPEPVHQYFNS